MKLKLKFVGLALVAGFIASAAVAQVIPAPQPSALGQADITNVIPGGQPTAQTKYIQTGAIGGQELYSFQVPLTAFAITIPAHTSLMMINPAGTLATGAFTMEATPSDGQRMCLLSTQTQTAMTVAGNTGQTIGGGAAATALVANTKICYTYIAVTSTWYRHL